MGCNIVSKLNILIFVLFLQVWIFGDIWCSVWLAVDVWMCTASILNLCVISLDRYLAVTRPVTYPSIMSMRKAKLLIAMVWVFSFFICLPPLLGWRDKHTGEKLEDIELEPPCPWRCDLTKDQGYVLYSALGSFFIPMFVMLFFYWRIYIAAIQTTKAINQGFRTTKGSRTLGNRFDEQRLTLRIHRGRGSVMQGSSGSNSTTTTNSATNSVVNSTTNSPGGGKSPRRERRHERIKISVSYPSSDAISSVVNNNSTAEKSPPSPTGTLYAVHCEGGAEGCALFRKDTLRVSPQRRGRRSNSDAAPPRPRLLGDPLSVSLHKDLSPSPTYEENNKPKLISRMGKRNIKAQVKRFRMETKAAKTLGIIVGGFILCWLPFFTMYLVRAFCNYDCIHPTVFSAFFWLGYCNSAINPCIYALFSKDFRFAFKRIICRCLCSKQPRSRGSSRYRRRGSDGSALGIRRGEQGRSGSLNNNDHAQHQSDSDPNNDVECR